MKPSILLNKIKGILEAEAKAKVFLDDSKAEILEAIDGYAIEQSDIYLNYPGTKVGVRYQDQHKFVDFSSMVDEMLSLSEEYHQDTLKVPTEWLNALEAEVAKIRLHLANQSSTKKMQSK